MPTHGDDRLLWFIAGAALLLAARAIPHTLHHIRKVTEITHDESSATKPPEQDAEDKLKLDTLQKLIAGDSYELRSSAFKIVADRCTKPHPRALLLQDLRGHNEATRNKAIDAMWFLFYNPAVKEAQLYDLFTDSNGYGSVITALVNLLPEHNVERDVSKPVGDTASYPSPIFPPNRPTAERSLLIILHRLLLAHGTNTALSAGIISRWLSRYPFPCALPCNGSRRQDVIDYFKRSAWGSDDPLMEPIMSILVGYPAALKQFRQHGLMASRYKEEAADDEYCDSDGDVVMTGINLADPIVALPDSSWSRRQPENSEEEMALRRRRREAMVISDGGAPLTQDNILQRESSRTQVHRGAEDQTNSEIAAQLAQLAQLNEEIDREDEELLQDALEDGRNAIERTRSISDENQDGGIREHVASLARRAMSWFRRTASPMEPFAELDTDAFDFARR